ncbi:MAG: hypothetical protein AB7V45_03870 [Candidatus Krumholzibacteriia bacterium]
MKIFLPILLTAGLLACPCAADRALARDHDRAIRVSGETSLDFEDDLLVIRYKHHRSDDEVTVSAKGDLVINGRAVATDERERKLLQKFHSESRQLVEMAEAVALDAGEIAAASTAYAAAAIRSALASLGDEDEGEDVDADLESDFEERIEMIEEVADEIGDRADRVEDLAEELNERIPELAALGWFLDD